MRLGPAEVRFTGRAEGDLGSVAERGPEGPSPACVARRAAVVDLPWTWLRQVHGANVVTVDRPGAHAGAEADGAVTATRGAVLAILTADCAPLALASAEGVIGGAHAGWRGLLAGVVEETAAAMRALGATGIEAALGPCIHGECYEFADADLEPIARRLGPAVRSHTATGAPALDVPAAVAAACERADVDLVWRSPICTACDADGAYSHRARRDDERQALAIWLP